MTRALQAYPKVELHLHLEGCLTPAEGVRLASKAPAAVAPASIKALYRHGSLQEFLAHFGQLVSLFKRPEDLRWLLERVLLRLKRQGVVYAEIRVSPSVWERHGLDPEPPLQHLLALVGKGPIPFALIVDAVRQWDRRLIERDLDLALKYRQRGVAAFGLGGDESAAPAARLKWVADECRRRRMPVIPHAGEALGPEEVASAIAVFSPRRIGHGTAVARDEELMKSVAEGGIHLEVCPTSNLRTGVVKRAKDHPLKTLWRGGLSLSLGTDDPGLFGSTLCSELEWAADHAGWCLADMARSQAMAARSAFLPERERNNLERMILAAWPDF